MEITLIAVTLLSLFLAISMGVVAWRLVQEERRRSDARLAALAAELRGGEGTAANEGPEPFVPELPAGSATDAPASAGVAGLFSTATDWRRLVALAGAAVVVTAVVGAVFLSSGNGAGNATAPDDGRPPLDLIALGHAAEGPFLDISGSVRNPAAAPDVERLSVVALAFDAAGTLVATRRTPVETSALPPGAHSPFTIRLLAAGVSRYRISFLLDGTTVPHVDRRPTVQPPASAGDPS